MKVTSESRSVNVKLFVKFHAMIEIRGTTNDSIVEKWKCRVKNDTSHVSREKLFTRALRRGNGIVLYLLRFSITPQRQFLPACVHAGLGD